MVKILHIQNEGDDIQFLVLTGALAQKFFQFGQVCGMQVNSQHVKPG